VTKEFIFMSGIVTKEFVCVWYFVERIYV